MQQNSAFSADDRSRRSSFTDRRTIGELDTSYRVRRTSGTDNIKHVAVRDATGSFTEEEPVHAFMVPSEYLKPDANRNMPPKRPLGSSARPESAAQAVPMYSQVATFGLQPRVRRERTLVPLEQHITVSWTAKLKNFVKLLAALIVAGLLFIGEKIKIADQYVAQKLHRVPLLRSRTIYSVFRGVRLERLGMRDSRFRVVTPLAIVLIIAGIGVFSGLVSDSFHMQKKSHEATNTAQQGNSSNAVQNNNNRSTNSTQNAAISTQQAGGLGGGANGTAPSSSSGGGAGAAQTTSGGSGGLGGGGGIDPGGVTVPIPPATSPLPVTTPTLPPAPIQQPAPAPLPAPSLPVTPPPAPQPISQPLNDVTQTIDNTVQQAPQTLNNTLQQAPQTLNSTVQSVPQTLNSTTSSATGALGL